MSKSSKLLKTIAFYVALNIFGVYVGALFNFHMHHIFHKALVPQDMVCSRDKQKFIYTVTDNHHEDGSSFLSDDVMIAIDLSDQLLPVTASAYLSQFRKTDPLVSYTGHSESLRAPPLS
jgi:hypothetical protein